jgi:hypothetical protein
VPKLLSKFVPRKAKAPLPASAPPAPEADAQADALAGRLWELLSAQAPVPLTERERKRAGGLVFRGAPQLVRGVAAALEERPDLFADAPKRAAKLRQGERRARLFQSLHVHLARMARLAADSYLAEQGGATEAALQIVEEARHLARDPALPWPERVPGGAASERALALADALRVLGRRQRKKRKARATRRRAERRLAATRVTP